MSAGGKEVEVEPDVCESAESVVTPVVGGGAGAVIANNTTSERNSGTSVADAPTFADRPSRASLPEAFREFLRRNHVNEAVYDIVPADLPRFIRTNPCSGHAPLSADELSKDLGTPVTPVAWLPGFFSLRGSVKLVRSACYREGRVYGIDAASGAAVAALDPQPGDDVLDVCCAPGAKLAMIADWMRRQGSVTGVDIAQERVNSCCSILTKYGVVARRQPRSQRVPSGAGVVAASQQAGAGAGAGAGGGAKPDPSQTDRRTAQVQPWVCRVYCGDGTTFNVPPPARGGTGIGDSAAPARDCGAILNLHTDVRVDVRRARKRKAAAEASSGDTDNSDGRGTAVDTTVASVPPPQRLYDRVLVDAECTHDGSIKHISKFHSWGWERFEQRVLSPERMAKLTDLQKRLARNGFRLLKPGGIMVYSTCSLTTAQNEDVVTWLLRCEPSARLTRIPLGGCPRCSGAAAATTVMQPRRGAVAAPGSGPGCNGQRCSESGTDRAVRGDPGRVATSQHRGSSTCPACDRALVWDAGRVPLTLRFNPLRSRTSGLFIARLRKVNLGGTPWCAD